MLEDVIRKYGADPHHLTESARITKIESEGIVNVVHKEKFAAGLDAILTAELVDNAGWELLIRLAKEIDDSDVEAKFKDALKEEAEHLKFIRDQILNSTIAKLKVAEAA
jgi:hypothetical protein